MLYSRPLLVIPFKYDNVYTCIPNSWGSFLIILHIYRTFPGPCAQRLLRTGCMMEGVSRRLHGGCTTLPPWRSLELGCSLCLGVLAIAQWRISGKDGP